MTVTGDGMPAKEGVTVVNDVGRFPVHLPVGPDDLAAKRFGDRLVAQADAQDRNAGVGRGPDEFDGNARPRAGVHGPGRHDDRRWARVRAPRRR